MGVRKNTLHWKMVVIKKMHLITAMCGLHSFVYQKTCIMVLPVSRCIRKEEEGLKIYRLLSSPPMDAEQHDGTLTDADPFTNTARIFNTKSIQHNTVGELIFPEKMGVIDCPFNKANDKLKSKASILVTTDDTESINTRTDKTTHPQKNVSFRPSPCLLSLSVLSKLRST